MNNASTQFSDEELKNGCLGQNCEYVNGDFCRRYPMTAIPIQMQHPISGQTTMALQGALPPLIPNATCGEYLPGIEKAKKPEKPDLIII